ncbi:MAG: hypothetical protein LBS97_00290 [Treponema sp.]|jgi:hypothetical protein|nr:hypothetical protein [Treponema sp.]
MEKIGLGIDMTDAVGFIFRGRLGLITDGQEHEGRLTFESGIRQAHKVFAEARASEDPELMLLAEYTYMSQTLEYATERDTVGRSRAQAVSRCHARPQGADNEQHQHDRREPAGRRPCGIAPCRHCYRPARILGKTTGHIV